MVQRILEAIDGQVVESIEDTREAMQVANCIKESYEHLLYTRDIKAKSNLIQMQSLSNVEQPTVFHINDNLAQISMFKYFDKANERYIDLQWMEPEQFIELTLNRNPLKDNVKNVTEPTSGVRYNVYTDRAPTYYTSFDDKHIVCDAYNSEDGHTLMEEYTVVYGYVMPEFKLEDEFVPDLAPQHFSLLLSTAKVQAAYELNREFDQLENNRAMKQKATADRHAQRQRGQDGTTWKRRKRNGRVL